MAKPLAVLIVEDSESDTQLIVRLLKKAGYDVFAERVETAEQMRAALEKQAWDIVISDYSLPQFDGRAALTLLQETGQDIPFIAVSGTMGEETAVAMMKAGAHDYLIKGSLARLVPAVERELAQAEIRREQRKAEEALRKKDEHYRNVVESIFRFVPEGLLVFTENLSLVKQNKAFEEITQQYAARLGYTEQELADLIAEQARRKILSGDTTEIQIPKKRQ